MNKLERLKKMIGNNFVDEFVRELEQYPTGLDDRVDSSLSFPSGNVMVLDGSTYDYGIVTGVHDPHHYPVLEQHEIDELWKCQNCGRVYRMKDTLECKSCGSPITEDSRFVLER